jgi:hypothetical protein
MARDDDILFDAQAGPLVRPYAVTRGRTRAARSGLDLVTLVIARYGPEHPEAAGLDSDHLELLRLCGRPVSVAELSAQLVLPVCVVKILRSDLVEQQLVIFRASVAPDLTVLRAVINGIRRL